MKKTGIFLALMVFLSGCASTDTEAGKSLSFSFGVIADIQYADKDGARRDYRGSLGRLEKCVEELNSKDLAFTIQVGDIIDGNASKEETLSDLERVLKIFNTLSMPKYHVVGNHCLAAGKAELRQALGLDRLYYEFTVPEASGWRFVVLNGNDAGYGVVGKEQREWLRRVLKKAERQDERVIVFNHFPLMRKVQHAETAKDQELLALISESDRVAAYFAGHHHGGGYVLYKGVHHVIFKGMVEAGKENSFAVISVTDEVINKTGFGAEPSREMPLAARN